MSSRIPASFTSAPPAGANSAAPAAEPRSLNRVAKVEAETIELTLSQRVYQLLTQGPRVSQIASALNLSEDSAHSDLNISSKS